MTVKTNSKCLITVLLQVGQLNLLQISQIAKILFPFIKVKAKNKMEGLSQSNLLLWFSDLKTIYFENTWTHSQWFLEGKREGV